MGAGIRPAQNRSAMVKHKTSASSPKPDICAEDAQGAFTPVAPDSHTKNPVSGGT